MGGEGQHPPPFVGDPREIRAEAKIGTVRDGGKGFRVRALGDANMWLGETCHGVTQEANGMDAFALETKH